MNGHGANVNIGEIIREIPETYGGGLGERKVTENGQERTHNKIPEFCTAIGHHLF
jgi:hypothetical protein